MYFGDEFDQAELEEAYELLTNWQRWGRAPKHKILSPTWTTLMSIRLFYRPNKKGDEDKSKSAESEYVEPIDEKKAELVEALMQDKSKWYAHHYERATLLKWFDWRLIEPVPPYIICRKFKCSYRNAELQVKCALRYFNKLRKF